MNTLRVDCKNQSYVTGCVELGSRWVNRIKVKMGHSKEVINGLG